LWARANVLVSNHAPITNCIQYYSQIRSAQNQTQLEGIDLMTSHKGMRGMFGLLQPQKQANIDKKRFASLRFCVSSLHRDHALRSLHSKAAYNLLCVVKHFSIIFSAQWYKSSLHCKANLLCIVEHLLCIVKRLFFKRLI